MTIHRVIAKRTDPEARRLREVRDGRDSELIFGEGENLAAEAVRSGAKIRSFYARKDRMPQAVRLASSLPTRPPAVELASTVMEFVSDVKTPPGLIFVAERPAAPSLDELLSNGSLFLVLDQMRNPQNVGTLCRTAEAAGVDALTLSLQSADAFSPKALRSSAGSAFRLPIIAGCELNAFAEACRRKGIELVGALQAGEIVYDRWDWTRRTALVVGGENTGIADRDILTATLRIPMRGRIESLNAATAASVCLFEADRQRRAASR